MAEIKYLVICWKCDPPHISNCATCYGWGYRVTGLPVRGVDLDTITESHRCRTCGSNHRGYILFKNSDGKAN